MKKTTLDSGMQEKFDDLLNELSPENLTCDGELPPSRIAAKLNDIHRRWTLLERKIDRMVSKEEVWDNHARSH